MELCDNNHVSIVHDERDCPLCEANNDNEKLTNEASSLEEQLSDAQDTIADLEKEAEAK